MLLAHVDTEDAVKRYIDKFLKATAFVFDDDSPLTDDEKDAWVNYRQELRDMLNSQEGVPWGELVWPDPPADDIADSQRKEIPDAEARIRRVYARQMKVLVRPYSIEERETWWLQLQEADAYLADNNNVGTMIQSIATARGITVGELVNKIKQNDNAFRGAVGTIIGNQQAEIDALP